MSGSYWWRTLHKKLRNVNFYLLGTWDSWEVFDSTVIRPQKCLRKLAMAGRVSGAPGGKDATKGASAAGQV